MTPEPIEPTDFDGAWKETLETCLFQFLDICFPTIARTSPGPCFSEVGMPIASARSIG